MIMMGIEPSTKTENHDPSVHVPAWGWIGCNQHYILIIINKLSFKIDTYGIYLQ